MNDRKQDFRKEINNILDGKTAIYRSAHPYLDRDDPLKGPVYIEREHPLVMKHPATGWKSLFVNRAMTTKIVELDMNESRTILEYLFSIFEKILDIQVRFRWQPSKKRAWELQLFGITEFHNSMQLMTTIKTLTRDMELELFPWKILLDARISSIIIY